MKSTDGLPRAFLLNGDWDFGYTPDISEVKDLKLPATEIFETEMPVPGYWDLNRERMAHCKFYGRDAVFNPEYRPIEFPMGEITPDASLNFIIGTGWYKKRIFIAPEYKGRAFILKIGPSVMNAAVWCNGKKACTHTGFSTPFETDLTSFIKSGQENEIVIAVSNAANNRRSCAIRGYKGRMGGINGGIEMFVTDSFSIEDWHLFSNEKGLVWDINFRGKMKDSYSLKWKITDEKKSRKISSGEFILNGKTSVFKTDVPALEKWSDCNPYLYNVELSLCRKGRVIERSSRLWGLRELKTRGIQIFLNGSPVYLRGSTEHYYFPETCVPPSDKRVYIDNIKKLKHVGFNWLRCHTWCPPEEYLQAGDELGIMFQVEVPRDSEESEWLDIIKAARKHPSVILFCGGNEEFLDEAKIKELSRLAAFCRKYAPDALFNPQEAMRGIEYGDPENSEINLSRLKKLAEFSDVYGQYSWGCLSYFAGDFDKTEELDEKLKPYKKPCLSHEVGILGNYLNIDLENRYRNSHIGTELFSSARKCLEKAGLVHKAALYYNNSCELTRRIRKHNIENARRCENLSGYDFLGGIDTHWHRCGYPCGILNEFYELKPGDSESEIMEYNGRNIILLDIGCRRNFFSGRELKRKIMVSYWGNETLDDGKIFWHIENTQNTVLQRGEIKTPPLQTGTLTECENIFFKIPPLEYSSRLTLKCRFSAGDCEFTNHWDLWVFPENTFKQNTASVIKKLDERTLDRIADGERILLTEDVPFDTEETGFSPPPAGRVKGDLATVIYEHPALENFSHDRFCDWQFYPMLKDARSMIFDNADIPFEPIIEIVSSFKHVIRKAALCEFKIGRGLLMVSTLNFRKDDPASITLRRGLITYLASGKISSAPVLNLELLKNIIRKKHAMKKVSETDMALDPNA
ncbi:MAG: hypothetical protein A2017_00415 [Lentisphaerae bacterium GWF2_44_16]|nr:MAG: hypothetical protein A2017_00415 [Lentisphaerae bacterium GWF2_44_16]